MRMIPQVIDEYDKGTKSEIEKRGKHLRGLTPTVAQKWANSLRSGEFKQTIHTLQSKKGVCCLGGACLIFIPEKRQERWDDKLLKGSLPYEQTYAPLWLKEVNDDLQERMGEPFSDLNDDFKYNFNEIADIIELVYVHKVLGK